MHRPRLVTISMVSVKKFARSAAGMAGLILFPPICCGCQRRIGRTGVLCPQCWRDLHFIERPWCDVLGTPFSRDMGAGLLSAAAIANPPDFDRARAAVAYDGVARRLVQGLKFNDRTDLAPWMAAWMARVASELMPDADVIIPVPLHRRRFIARRFNQSAELARALAKLTDLPFDPSCVQRVKVTRQQVGLGLQEREANVRGAFRVPGEADIRVRGRRVLLVDDVYTTGATASAVARALKKAGAAGVDVITFARALSPRPA